MPKYIKGKIDPYNFTIQTFLHQQNNQQMEQSA